jgi:hypothetical protein
MGGIPTLYTSVIDILLALHIYQEMSVIIYIGVLIRLRLLFDDILPSEGRQLGSPNFGKTGPLTLVS